jgi:glutathione peroxidase
MWRTIVMACALAGVAGTASAGGATATPGNCPALLQHEFPRLQDEKRQSLCQYSGKVLLVVNTASFCGFTPQYQGLEALQKKWGDRGLVVLGFPSNDFSQESGSNQQIAQFCESTFGVKFPMFAKSSVRGADANPFFKQLAQQTGRQPMWNFHKYLVARDGRAVAQFSSLTAPDDRALTDQIEKLLSQR